MIPDDLARELCESLNLWDGGSCNIDEDESVEHWLAPVIAKHLDQLAPPRDCCPSRRGQMHQNCKALSDALNEETPA